MDGVNVDAVHAAVAACPGVAGLGSGTVSSLTTYLPGRRLSGIRINPDSVDLEIIAAWGTAAADIYRQIQTAVTAAVGGRRIDLTIADIQLPDDAESPVDPSPPQADTSSAQPELSTEPVGRSVLPAGDVYPPASIPRLESDST